MNPHETENRLLRRQLQALMDEARVNEDKWRRLDQLEKRLIATPTMSALIQVILNDYRAASETDVVTLVLADPDHEIRRTLEHEKIGGSELPGLVLLDALYSNELTPHIGVFDTELDRAIFDPWPANCHSMILLPLIRQDKVIGSLNLASRWVDRFTPDSSTDFVERMASILAICIENSLNHERLKQVGLTDPLTGVFNRRYFESRCQEEVAHVRRRKSPLSCMFLDIDKFKRINDTHGHAAGDKVLCMVAKLIKSGLRGNDVMARFGGEEFVVLLPQTRLQTACEIAERIRATIEAQSYPVSAKENLAVTISIGVAQAQDILEEEDMAAARKLLAAADDAVYQAKKSGRNKVVSEADRPATGVMNGLNRLLNFS